MKKLLSLLLALLMCLTVIAASADYADAIYSTARVHSARTVIDPVGNYDADHYYVVVYETLHYTGSAFAVGTNDKEVRYFVTNQHNCATENEFDVLVVNKALYAETGDIEAAAVGVDSIVLPCTNVVTLIFDNLQNEQVTYVLGVSSRTDLAVLELSIPTDKRKPMVLQPFEEDELGKSPVYAVGFPGAADIMVDDEHNANWESSPNLCVVTNGMSSNVLSHGHTQSGEIIGHSAPISGGNSGGPLVNEKGHVLGVNTWGVNTDGLYYSVSVNEVIRLLDELDVDYKTASTLADLLPFIGIAVAVALVIVLVIVLSRTNRKSGFILVGVVGDLRGKAFPLYKSTLVGRASSAQIRYPDNSDGVSGKHCVVEVKNGVITVTDTSSRGTWIDNVKLTPGVPTAVKQGQTIFLGSAKHGMMIK